MSRDLIPFTCIRLRGSDRLRFLHSFCTAEVQSMLPGTGTEAFVLNVKGKTIAHVIVLVCDAHVDLMVFGHPDGDLIQHLDRYIFAEDVALADITDSMNLVWLRELPGKLASLAKLPDWAHERVSAMGWPTGESVSVVASRITSDRDWLVLIEGEKVDSAQLGALVQTAFGVGDVPPESEFHDARIAAAWPINAVDLTTQNLPQEFGRDDRAISFTKGCYLGQETVARLDAMGHVNKKLVRLDFENALDRETAAAAVGAELFVDDEAVKQAGESPAVGQVTSCGTRSALAFLRVRTLTGSGRFRVELPGHSHLCCRVAV